ncbi:hypothetical protein LLEC1_04624 [Akanthomyces lecanii]|uniref:Uncharacterized protein n=1 Tax=Cordyceps confragosa TaxID=2714763 RepID=A0A179HZT4_CORDF|nr:hypothetical protein LLEC1_04624 [Akanthomyces lecanii]
MQGSHCACSLHAFQHGVFFSLGRTDARFRRNNASDTELHQFLLDWYEPGGVLDRYWPSPKFDWLLFFSCLGLPIQMPKRGHLDGEEDTSHAEKARKLDDLRSVSVRINATVPNVTNEDYTIGWICALATEYVAARALLDDKHGKPEYLSPNDGNNYTLGQMGHHKVVIAVLPDGKYGTASAAAVASDMMCSFRNVRVGLMVGIAGGAPSPKNDIRLGDIVVSSPQDNKPGVIQYDFGKNIQGQSFKQTGVLNQPPLLLRAAVSGLKAEYEADGNYLEDKIDEALRKKPRLRQNYGRPDADSDRLYVSHYLHLASGDQDCVQACGTESRRLVARPARDEDTDQIFIHYGNIASGNTLMKNAEVRDTLSEQQGILCFEMEAAGLMDGFPCIVVRGICDYSDSHKLKDWQGYASMAAAAYAKDLLAQIVPSKVEAEASIAELIAEEHLYATKSQLGVAEEQLKLQRVIAEDRLSKKEQQCHQLFRLASDERDVTYEWYKERVENRVENTCLWFLGHEHFQEWLKQDSGPLVVSADPGCGKSVLAKYLIDHVLPRSATVCYFFFKDQDQNTVRQSLCAILHQLFSQLSSLLKHAMPKFHKDGDKLIWSTKALWQILQDATSDPNAGSIIIVFDALDECEESEFGDLVQGVSRLFVDEHHEACSGSLRFLMTCRPYEQIVSKFNSLMYTFPNIRVPGEEESEAISKEINHVITHRVNLLKEGKKLSNSVRDSLESTLKANTHRTYLWIYLVFDYLESQNFKKTEKGIKNIIATLPETVNQAYEKILRRCDARELPMVRKALGMTLAAARPLKLDEMNIALNVEMTTNALDDLDLEATADFKARLRSACGLFLSIHHNQVYFLHQTAREFLLQHCVETAGATQVIGTSPNWHQSFTMSRAHDILAHICVCVLGWRPGNTKKYADECLESNLLTFFHYAALHWAMHFREADIAADAPIVAAAANICNVNSAEFSRWRTFYTQTNKEALVLQATTSVGVAICNGHSGMAERLIADGVVDINARIGPWSPLCLASSTGLTRVVQSLLESGAQMNGGEELSEAVYKGYKEVSRLLLTYGAKANAIGGPSKMTPLADAVKHGNNDIVELLLEYGVKVDSRNDQNGLTAFLIAVRRKDVVLAALLLDMGADVEAKTPEGDTALHIAASRSRNMPLATLLLDRGADSEAKTLEGNTALHIAASRRVNSPLATLLLDRGANFNVHSHSGQTALHTAVANRNMVTTKLLLERGATIEAQDEAGRTALHIATSGTGNTPLAALLLDRGANVEAKDKHGCTALHLAVVCWWASSEVARLLLQGGADIEAKDATGRTALMLAAVNGSAWAVKLLLKRGAKRNAMDRNGRMPWLFALRAGHNTIAEML